MLRNKRPGSHSGGNKTLIHQPFVGKCNGHTRHTQTPGKFARGRQKFTRPESAFQDRRAELAKNFAAQVLAIDKTDVNLHAFNVSAWLRGLDWSSRLELALVLVPPSLVE